MVELGFALTMFKSLLQWWPEPTTCHIEYTRQCAALSTEVTSLGTHIDGRGNSKDIIISLNFEYVSLRFAYIDW